MFAGLNSVYYMLHYTKTCKFSMQHKCQFNGQFSKKSDRNICLIDSFANGIEKKCKLFINILVLLSVAVSVLIYCDTYCIALHVS